MNNNILFKTYEYIRSAAQLRLQLEPWIIDQNEASKGKKIFYAVDTDIVKMYTDPIGKKKYVYVFPDDDSYTREILSRALARFIFFQLSKDRPLFIIPPHDQEIERVFFAIARNAAEEQEEVADILPRIKTFVKKYKQTQNIENLVSSLKKEPQNLINCFYGEGYIGELNRVNELLKHDCLLHIERYKEHDHNDNPWAMPILETSTKSEDYDCLKELVRSWTKRLNLTIEGKKKKRRYLITNDAQVLARLEWINRELEVENTGKRLILISGSPSLRKAALNLRWDEQYTFADLFVRDPKVFLSAIDLVGNERFVKENTDRMFKSGLIGWLDVFLARYQSGLPGYEKRFQQNILDINKDQRIRLARLFTEKTQNDSEAITNFKYKWKQLISYAAMIYGLDERGTGSMILQKFADLLTRKDIDKIQNEIEKQFLRVIQDFWEFAAVTGFWTTSALLNTKKYLPLRGVPALRFTFEPESNIAEYLCRTLDYRHVLEKNLSFKKLRIEDPTGYTGFLLHALAFGAGGRWIGTLILSGRALNLLTGKKRSYCLAEGHEPITGNEAAYLHAWAIRHNAKVPYQLNDARMYLKKAEELKAIALGGVGADIRYESEAIAIDMTYHLFRIFSDFESYLPENFPSLAKCQKNILDILIGLEQNEDEKQYVRITVKKQLLAYFFCATLLRQFKEKEKFLQKEKNEISEWLLHFREIIKCEEHRTRTCFTIPVYKTACCIYGTKTERAKYKREIEDILAEDKIRHCYVMPYDERLYEFFRYVARNSN